MEITLKRSGGIIPVQKVATKKVDWSEQELDAIIAASTRKEAPLTRGRDETGYFLEVNGQLIPIDLDKIPAAYKTVFDNLKKNLKPLKF
jgi:hypothetical protein